jgi:hypothetical protein
MAHLTVIGVMGALVFGLMYMVMMSGAPCANEED